MEWIVILSIARDKRRCYFFDCFPNLVSRSSQLWFELYSTVPSRWVSRQNSSLHDSSFKYRRVLLLVIESGAIYSSALVIEITLYFLNNNAFYIIYDPIAQLTASVPIPLRLVCNLKFSSYTAGNRTYHDHRHDES